MDECLVNYKHSFVPDLLKDKVAFITGGGSGIGFTIAEILMRHGCDMAIASRSEGRLQEAAKKLEAATGRRCFYVAMDIRKPAEVMSAVDKILEQYGKIDILVNNAAGNFLAPLAAMSFNAFRTVLEIDTFGTFNASKALFDKYFKNHGGVIVNISATLYYKGRALQAHAGPAKAAIDALTKHMAVEWGPLGIRVNSVAPGPIEGTEGIRKLGGPAFDKDQQRLLRQVPVGRMGKKEEIGHMTLYLVSDLGSYVTGTVAVVDGGSWMASGNSMEEATDRMKAILAQGKL